MSNDEGEGEKTGPRKKTVKLFDIVIFLFLIVIGLVLCTSYFFASTGDRFHNALPFLIWAWLSADFAYIVFLTMNRLHLGRLSLTKADKSRHAIILIVHAFLVMFFLCGTFYFAIRFIQGVR